MSVWDPREGWGVMGLLSHYPCPAEGVWALWWCCPWLALLSHHSSGAQDGQTTQGWFAPTKAPRNRRAVVKTQMQKVYFSPLPPAWSCLPSGSLPWAKEHHVNIKLKTGCSAGCDLFLFPFLSLTFSSLDIYPLLIPDAKSILAETHSWFYTGSGLSCRIIFFR